MSRALLCVLCCTSMGCWTRDNAVDTGRCDPACTRGETCWQGQCVKPDGGASGPDVGGPDGISDGGPASEPMLFKKCRSSEGTGAATSSTSPVTVPCHDGDFALTLKAGGTEKYLFILNVTDSWLTCNGEATFGLVDIDETSETTLLASSKFTPAPGQRLPINVVATRALSPGDHTIKVQWSRQCGSGDLVLGAQNDSWLIVVRADAQDLQAVYGPKNLLSMDGTTSGPQWVDLDLSSDKTPTPSITVPEPGGDYLLLLNVTSSYPDEEWGECRFRIVRDRNGTVTSLGSVIYNAAFANQRVPATVVAATNLAAGDVIRPQWACRGYVTYYVEAAKDTDNAAWLVALRTPKGISSSFRANSDVSTTSQSPASIPDLAPLMVTAKGTNHLLVLAAPDLTTYATGGALSYLQLQVDGLTEASSVSSSGHSPYQTVPGALFAVKNLAAGDHNIKGLWSSGAQSELLGAYPAGLIALTR